MASNSSNQCDNAKRKTRLQSDIWLIGPVRDTFVQTTRLPTICETLSVFFYHHRENNKTLKDSARITVSEILTIWQKAAIPTAYSYHIENRLLKVHQQWQCLSKAKNRRSEKQISNEIAFSSKIDKLFDIAHQRAEKLTEQTQDLEFLRDQRKRRIGYMAGVDKAKQEKEEQKAQRKERSERFMQKVKNDQETLSSQMSSTLLQFSSDSSSDERVTEENEHDEEFLISASQK